MSGASRVRWWYQRARAWWRRLQASQCAAWPGGARPGEQAGDLGDGQRDHARVGGGRLAGPDRRRCLGIGAVLEQGGGDGADGQGGHDQHGVPGDRGVEPDLGLIEAEAVLAGPESFFHRPAQPGRADQPGQGQRLAFGHEAVVKGQLAGLEVAADQQVVLRGGGGQPRPGIPARALGALPGGADLGVLAGQQHGWRRPRRLTSCRRRRVRRKFRGTRST